MLSKSQHFVLLGSTIDGGSKRQQPTYLSFIRMEPSLEFLMKPDTISNSDVINHALVAKSQLRAGKPQAVAGLLLHVI